MDRPVPPKLNICEWPGCGQPVFNRFCGKSHSNKWQHKFGGKKSGFKYQKQPMEIWIEKYGIEEAERRAAARDAKRSASMMGENNHFFGKDHTPEFKALSSRIHKGKTIPEEVTSKMSATHSARIASGNGYNPTFVKTVHGVFETSLGMNMKYASSFELIRMKYLDTHPDVKQWTNQHGIVIPYTVNHKKRSYVPDFMVITNRGTFIEEVKGWIREQNTHLAKFAAATEFCASRGWSYRVLFKNDLETL